MSETVRKYVESRKKKFQRCGDQKKPKNQLRQFLEGRDGWPGSRETVLRERENCANFLNLSDLAQILIGGDL